MAIKTFSLPQEVVTAIAENFTISNYVQTGILSGDTVMWASRLFKNVYVIEKDSIIVKNTISKNSFSQNIKVITGDSRNELAGLLPSLQGRSVFFLAGHSVVAEGRPVTENLLRDELEVLKGQDNSVIFINDIARLSGPSPVNVPGWISMDELFVLCKKLFPGSFLTIIDGVLLCAPKDMESVVSDYWLKTFDQRFFQPDAEAPKKSIFERAVSKAKRELKKKKPLEAETIAYDINNSEWFENQCQIFYNSHKWLQEQGFKSIIDVGANVGQFGKKIRQYYPDAKLYSFEPIPLVYKKLAENFEGDKNFKGFNVGLGDKEGKLDFYMNEFSDSSSMLKMGDLHKENFPFTKNEKKIQVDVMRLDHCIDINEIEKPYLLKLDVQGFEEQVLDGGLEIASNAEMIITEASFRELYEGQSLFDTLYEKLKAMGFQYIGNLDQMNSAFNGMPLQGDAIFQKVKEKK